MSVEDIIRIINSVGFPIVAYGALFYVFFIKLMDRLDKVTEKLNELERLDQVTQALNKLSERLSVLIAQNDKRESTT